MKGKRLLDEWDVCTTMALMENSGGGLGSR